MGHGFAVRFGETGLGNVLQFQAVMLLSKPIGRRTQSRIDGMHTPAHL